MGLASLLLFLGATPVRGTWPIRLRFEELIHASDLVGIVECVTSGGIVARYRIIEAWTGQETGSVITMADEVNPTGDQFPITLCGDRFLVAASRQRSLTRFHSITYASPSPLWWRQLPADYKLPLAQGKLRLPLQADGEPLKWAFNAEQKDLESFKKVVQELIALDPPAREANTMKSVLENYADPKSGYWLYKEPGTKTLLDAVRMAKAPEEVVRAILTLAPRIKGSSSSLAWSPITDGGGPRTLRLLEGPRNQLPAIDGNRLELLVQSIRERLGMSVSSAMPPEGDGDPPTASDLKNAIKELQDSGPAGRLSPAFDLLTRHDPSRVVEYLTSWKNPRLEFNSNASEGYILGSYFGWRCDQDRVNHLRSLLDAKDPFVRVASAVYLCFDALEVGVTELEKLVRLPGDPGVWAALALARRGRKSAVPRALKVFLSPSRGGLDGIPHVTLQTRVVVLLSNVACEADLVHPLAPWEIPGVMRWPHGREPSEANTIYEYYNRWWDAHGSRVEVLDPWLEVLDKKKVD